MQGVLSSIRSQLIQRLSEVDIPEPTPTEQESPAVAIRPSLFAKVSRWLLAEAWRIVTGIAVILLAALLAVYLGISQ